MRRPRSESPGSADALAKNSRRGAGRLRDRGSRRSSPRGARRRAPGAPGWACPAGPPRRPSSRSVAGLALVARGRPALSACTGLLLPVGLLVAGVPLAGVRALSGPPLAALALAGSRSSWCASDWRPPRVLFLPLVFAVLVVAAERTHARVGPEGDEPHYLMVAESLLRDGDLSLERDYAEGRYTAVPRRAARAALPRAREGRGDLLAARGRSVGPDPAGVGAGGVCRRHRASWRSSRPSWPSRSASGCATSPGATGWPRRRAGWRRSLRPSSTTPASSSPRCRRRSRFPFGLRRGRDEALGRGGALAVGLAAAALPWLNVRYAPLGRRRDRPRALAESAPSRVATGRPGTGRRLRALACSSTTRSLRLLGPQPRVRSPTRARPVDPQGGASRPAARPGVRSPRLRPRARAGAPRSRVPLAARPKARGRDRGRRQRRRPDRGHVAHVAGRLQPAGPLPRADRPASRSWRWRWPGTGAG